MWYYVENNIKIGKYRLKILFTDYYDKIDNLKGEKLCLFSQNLKKAMTKTRSTTL